MAAAQGSDNRGIDQVTVFAGGSQSPTTAQLFATVIQAVCRPGDVSQIDTWARAHVGGGQTDIDGYVLVIVDLSGSADLTILRSRP